MRQVVIVHKKIPFPSFLLTPESITTIRSFSQTIFSSPLGACITYLWTAYNLNNKTSPSSKFVVPLFEKIHGMSVAVIDNLDGNSKIPPF
jgi:hypothetical protein